MFCKYCGNKLSEDANFCPKCGKLVLDDEPVVRSEAPAEEKTIAAEVAIVADESTVPEEAIVEAVSAGPAEVELTYEEEKAKNSFATKIMVLGIVALATAVSVWFSLVGLIIGVIAKGKVREYVEKYGDTEGKASVGKGLATAAIPVSIALMVFMFFYILLIVVMVAAGV